MIRKEGLLMEFEQEVKDSAEFQQLTKQVEDALIISILSSLSEKKVLPKTVYENAVDMVLNGDGAKPFDETKKK